MHVPTDVRFSLPSRQSSACRASPLQTNVGDDGLHRARRYLRIPSRFRPGRAVDSVPSPCSALPGAGTVIAFPFWSRSFRHRT